MIQLRCGYKPGTVGYIAANSPRYHDFFDSIERLEVPLGTALGKSVIYNSASNRNGIVKVAVGDWILFLDDDHCFSDKLVFKMLERNVDILVAPYSGRYPPFEPVLFKCYHPDAPDPKDAHIWARYTWKDIEHKTGLMEIQGSGFGAVMVKMHVIEKMKEVWGEPLFRVGQFDKSWKVYAKDEMAEDLAFCWAARKVGFKVYADLDLPVGHITEVALIPNRDKEGRLRLMSDINGHCIWTTP